MNHILLLFVFVTFGASQVLSPLAINSLTGSAANSINVADEAEKILRQDFLRFKQLFHKVYSTPQEEKLRFENYVENRGKINNINNGFSKLSNTFSAAINELSDMLFHEFNAHYNGFKVHKGNRSRYPAGLPSAFIPSANVIYPNQVDWREIGAVTAVKNQQTCASCWAFATAGALEGQHFRKTGQLIDLSAQNLIDCCFPYDNDGCDGGTLEPAFQYVKENYGINAEDQYSYEAENNQCRYKPQGPATCTGFILLPEGDEKGLEAAVATVGPVSAAIHVTQMLQFYKNGVFFDAQCGNTMDDVNHAVLVVGYGTEPDGNEYWLIKNSYGPNWGLGGYFKLSRNRGNHCGIATSAAYPLV